MADGASATDWRFGLRQPVRRIEDRRLLTGGGRFTDDDVPAGALWLALRRAEHARGRILAVETAPARAMPGVRLVLTGADIEAAGLGPIPALPLFRRPDGAPMAFPPRPLLAAEEIRHPGQPVAAVVAETRAQALDAAEAIGLAIAPLPPLADVEAAAAPGAPQLWPAAPGNLVAVSRLGDAAAVEAAFAAAAHRVAVRVTNQRLAPFALEPRAAFALWDAAAERLTLRLGVQNPATVRAVLAEAVLRIPPARLRVLVEDIGGGFGHKSGLYPEDALLAHAARRLGRPVAWRAERSEEFLGGHHGRDQVASAEAAFDAEGRIAALRLHVAGNLGGVLSAAGAMVPLLLGSFVASGAYDVPALVLEAEARLTSTAPTAPYRGAGRPEAILLVERLMDAAGRATGLGPVEIRRRNLLPRIEAPRRLANGQVLDSGDLPRLLEEALARADWAGFPARRAAAEARGRLLGRGLAAYVEWTGAGQLREAVTMELDAGGRVTLWSATQAMGQGLATSYAQLLAAELGIPIGRIAVRQGDTDRVQGFGSMASRSLFVGGAAVAEGAARLKRELRRRAAEALEAAEADLDYAGGVFRIAGTDRTIDLAGLAARAPAGRIAVGSESAVEGASWPNGIHIAEVEIDRETGEARLVRHLSLDDVGVPVNPMIVRGQIHGGIAQGVGQALCEALRYDPQTGQLLTASLMDYAVPRADMLPAFDVALAEGVPCRSNPLGAKGCGESGTVGATPAVVAAVLDALAPFGVAHLDMPLTPEKVWRAMRGEGR